MYAKVKLANAHSYVLDVNAGIRFTPGKMLSFKTNLSPDPTCHFGNDILANLPDLLLTETFDRLYLVTNDTLDARHGAEMHLLFAAQGIACEVVTIADGEADRNFDTLQALCGDLQRKGITRESILIGFGGPALLAVAGLAASLLMGGVRYAEMPATFAAVTSACLSNRRAVYGKRGRNLYGSMYAPMFLFADTRFLQSENLADRKEAIAEGMRNAFVNDASLLPYFVEVLEQASVYNLDLVALSGLAFHIVVSRLDVNKKDPTEQGFVQALAYGEPFAGALQLLSGGTIGRGTASAVGMCMAAELSARMGFLSRDEVDCHYRLFGGHLGLDLRIPEGMDIDALAALLGTDDKIAASARKLVLLERNGRCLNPDGDYMMYVNPELMRQVVCRHNAVVARKLDNAHALHESVAALREFSVMQAI